MCKLFKKLFGKKVKTETAAEPINDTPVEEIKVEFKTEPVVEPVVTPEVKVFSKKELMDMTVVQLREIAKDLKIKAYYTLRKDDLVNAILKTK